MKTATPSLPGFDTSKATSMATPNESLLGNREPASHATKEVILLRITLAAAVILCLALGYMLHEAVGFNGALETLANDALGTTKRCVERLNSLASQ